MDKHKKEIGCPDCMWQGDLSEVISDIINEDVVSVCPNCRAFPLASIKDLFKKLDPGCWRV